MEIKWFAIGLLGFMIVSMIPLSIDTYLKNQCKIEAIKMNKSSEEIEKICEK